MLTYERYKQLLRNFNLEDSIEQKEALAVEISKQTFTYKLIPFIFYAIEQGDNREIIGILSCLDPVVLSRLSNTYYHKETPLTLAISTKNLVLTNFFLNLPQSIHQTQILTGKTPLILAIEHFNSLSLVKKILDLNDQGSYYLLKHYTLEVDKKITWPTALHTAVESANSNIFFHLFFQLNLEEQIKFSDSLLEKMIEFEQMAMITEFFQRISIFNDNILRSSMSKMTTLAAKVGNYEIFNFFYPRATRYQVDKISLWSNACYGGNLKVLEFLKRQYHDLSLGLSQNCTKKPLFQLVQSLNKQTLEIFLQKEGIDLSSLLLSEKIHLMSSVCLNKRKIPSEKHYEFVVYLFDKLKQPNIFDHFYSGEISSPLFDAALSGNSEILKFALSHAQKNLNQIQNIKGNTLLHQATFSKNIESIKLLKKYHFNPTQTNFSFESPLSFALSNSEDLTVLYLVNSLPRIEERAQAIQTCLSLALNETEPSVSLILSLLKETHLNPKYFDHLRSSTLYKCAEENHLECYMRLLEEFCSTPAESSQFSYSAGLSLAIKKDHAHIVINSIKFLSTHSPNCLKKCTKALLITSLNSCGRFLKDLLSELQSPHSLQVLERYVETNSQSLSRAMLIYLYKQLDSVILTIYQKNTLSLKVEILSEFMGINLRNFCYEKNFNDHKVIREILIFLKKSIINRKIEEVKIFLNLISNFKFEPQDLSSLSNKIMIHLLEFSLKKNISEISHRLVFFCTQEDLKKLIINEHGTTISPCIKNLYLLANKSLYHIKPDKDILEFIQTEIFLSTLEYHNILLLNFIHRLDKPYYEPTRNALEKGAYLCVTKKNPSMLKYLITQYFPKKFSFTQIQLEDRSHDLLKLALIAATSPEACERSKEILIILYAYAGVCLKKTRSLSLEEIRRDEMLMQCTLKRQEKHDLSFLNEKFLDKHWAEQEESKIAQDKKNHLQGHCALTLKSIQNLLSTQKSLATVTSGACAFYKTKELLQMFLHSKKTTIRDPLTNQEITLENIKIIPTETIIKWAAPSNPKLLFKAKRPRLAESFLPSESSSKKRPRQS